jgi:hypothetical protein
MSKYIPSKLCEQFRRWKDIHTCHRGIHITTFNLCSYKYTRSFNISVQYCRVCCRDFSRVEPQERENVRTDAALQLYPHRWRSSTVQRPDAAIAVLLLLWIESEVQVSDSFGGGNTWAVTAVHWISCYCDSRRALCHKQVLGSGRGWRRGPLLQPWFLVDRTLIKEE